MHLPRDLRRLCLAFVLVVLGVSACNIGGDVVVWLCLNPVTGKEDATVGDPDHFVNGAADPCHCYDPCGPSKECPISVDAGPPPVGCDAGDDGGA
jgi:hypothetical protein